MKRSELWDILYRLVNNSSDRLKLYNFFKELLTAEHRLEALEFFKADKPINQLSDYFYALSYNGIDYNFANEYFKNKYFGTKELTANCTVVGKDNIIGRNFDYYYNDKVSFLTRTAKHKGLYSVIGMAGQVNTLTKEFVESREYDEAYKILPFMLQDGINEHGLFAEINVVPTGDKGITTGTIPTDTRTDDVCMLMLVRYILDHYNSVEEVARELPKHVSIYAPNSDNFKGEYHFFIKDKDQAKIIEFINNSIVFIDCNANNQFMTNFYMYGVSKNENGHIDYNTVSDYGMGIERANSIIDNILNVTDRDTMMVLMKSLKYTNSYDSVYNWITEFCGNTETFGSLTVKDAFEHPEKFAPIIEYAKDIFAHRSRDVNSEYYGSWHTVHTAIYDIENMKVSIVTQENYADVKEFNFNDDYSPEEIEKLLNDKQDKLVSGQNIKTINSESLLGSGNMEIKDTGGDWDETNRLFNFNKKQ